MLCSGGFFNELTSYGFSNIFYKPNERLKIKENYTTAYFITVIGITWLPWVN
jgi:hypothetical protein